MLNPTGQRPGSSSSADDPYSGFDHTTDFDPAYDLEHVYSDREFVEAIARSSHGRRPTTANRMLGVPQETGLAHQRMHSSMGRPISTTKASPLRSAMGSRMGRPGTRSTAVADQAANRPMTAVRAAGYSSAGRATSDLIPAAPRTGALLSKIAQDEKQGESLEEKVRKQESDIQTLLVQSIMLFDERDYKKSLEKAKEAARRERASVKFRTSHSLADANLDLTLTVLTNLAQQYLANNMTNEALHVYQAIVKNPSFANSGRLRLNIGNIYFRKQDFPKALKHYRMALDQVPKVQQRTRTKILNNTGVALVKLGKYEDAVAAFENCLDTYGDYNTALNLVLAAYCLEDGDKIREAFQRLVDIPALVDDEAKDLTTEHGSPTAHLVGNDALSTWERRRKLQAEKTILIAAKVISQSIAGTFADGYAWCIETIKQSAYATLATELDMNKAVDLLKQGDLDSAIEALHTFNNKESKVASAASNNLALISFVRGHENLEDAIQHSEHSLKLDRYNANAFVNRGNIYYLNGELKLAQQCYRPLVCILADGEAFREALQIEASCVQGLFNLGLIAKEQEEWEEAKRYFFKLSNILVNNVQILTQLASIYERQDDYAQAIELYTQANNLSPSDPAILQKLATLYDAEGDKPQAFQCNYDVSTLIRELKLYIKLKSYRFYPTNIEMIKWLGNYYLYAQFPEKAVNYFEKAALMEPHNIEWQLLMASCQRRSGNFQKAMALYRQVHRKFPNNAECLKFLVQICKDLHLPEEKDYAEKLKKLEKIQQLKEQRESDSGQQAGKRPTSIGSLPASSRLGSGSSLRPTSPSRRNASATAALLNDPSTTQYHIKKKEINEADLVYHDSIGPPPIRPMTGVGVKQNVENIFENDDVLDDNLLPDD